MSASTSTSTSALPTRRQSLRQLPRAVGTAGPQLLASVLPTLRQSLRQLPRAVGTAGPQLLASHLSGHGWTSTAGFRSEWARWARLDLNRQVPSAVVTAEPPPGTFRAQWAALDLNLGPSELSGHRWTSTAR